jgi:hypothetical protein
MNSNLKQILIKRHQLVSESNYETKELKAYYNAFLLANFGIIVDKPELLTKEMIEEISGLYRLNVPASYFKNPQDMKYYTKAELFIEQAVSYFLAYGAEDSHIKVFQKDLPEYTVGDELTLREFKILTEIEARVALAEILKAYCAYTRPWSIDEKAEVLDLVKSNLYDDFVINCGDNASSLLDLSSYFAHFMYKKDLVKYSILKAGERSVLELDSITKATISEALPLVMDCPMSKKQAKYFNTLVKKVGSSVKKATNFHSPYRIAKEALDAGDVYSAARIYAAHGSLLERNLKMLISRADPITACKILKLLPAKNPLVLYQLVNTILADDGQARTFTFTKNNLVRHHIETEYETTWRKSKLNDATRKLVYNSCLTLIEDAYKAQPSLGKVYIADNFYKVALPINTSASGKGIDVLPTGSRLPIKGDYIRTFVHWEKAFDIDSSLILVNEDHKLETLYFGNYYGEPYGNDILFSGDVTSPTGTEYYDIKLENMRKRGYKYIISTFHGFCSNLNSGEIHCGYQDKSDLNTKAWDPKNIAFQMHVKGDSRACIAFAIDLETKEIIVLNLIRDSDSRVVGVSDYKAIEKYLGSSALDINIGTIIGYRGEIVSSPEEADIVFDDNYKSENENQKVVRSYETEKLVAIINTEKK